MRYAALSALTGLAILVGITAGGQAAPEDSIVLVYKVGRRPGTEGEIDLSALAGMLKKRLDPDGAYKRAVRPLGKDQIEIVLPRSLPMAKDGNNKLTADDVQWIKSLVTKAGNLEFRMLANEVDDKAAINEAIAMFTRANDDAGLKAELADTQGVGLPPPPLRKAGLKDLKPFTIKLEGGVSTVTYSWVELGPQELERLYLDNASEEDESRNAAWTRMAEARKKGLPIQLPTPGVEGFKLLRGALFYSRECKDSTLTKQDREQKKIDYFVLARNPEIDAATGKETPRLDGSYLATASASADSANRPSVSLKFNTKGGQLLRELTRKNVPAGGSDEVPHKRHVAVILDGLVLSSPVISAEIAGAHVQIAGKFTHREVDQLVDILRAGALPANARLVLVSETVIGPAQK